MDGQAASNQQNKAVSENPLGVGLVMVGAFALAVAAFLPLDEPIGVFRRVEDNTLIQHGGWMLVALALGIAASGYRQSRGSRTAGWVSIVLCVIAAALVVYMANNKAFRTLYPVGANGIPDTSRPGMVASLGIAIYVAGAGVAAALIGSLILLQSGKQLAADDPLVEAWEESSTKKCPDCAETILADAKVCKHCGYRFDATAASPEPTNEPKQPTNNPKPAPAKQSSTPDRQTAQKPGSLRPQFDPNRSGGLKGFIQDWKAIGEAQRKGVPPTAQKD